MLAKMPLFVFIAVILDRKLARGQKLIQASEPTSDVFGWKYYHCRISVGREVGG